MGKFISEDNLKESWKYIDELKQDKLPDGSEGQFLTIKNSEISWVNIDLSIINQLQNRISELESKLEEKLDKDQIWVGTNEEYESLDKTDKDRYYMIKEEA